MAIAVNANPVFTSSTPSILFEGTYVVGRGRSYDVAADGERFLMIKALAQAEDTGVSPAITELIVVQNWLQDVRRLVPVD